VHYAFRRRKKSHHFRNYDEYIADIFVETGFALERQHGFLESC